MNTAEQARRELLNQLDELSGCFDAISNLLSPEPTFEDQHRDNLSLLLRRLNSEQADLLARLRRHNQPRHVA